MRWLITPILAGLLVGFAAPAVEAQAPPPPPNARPPRVRHPVLRNLLRQGLNFGMGIAGQALRDHDDYQDWVEDRRDNYEDWREDQQDRYEDWVEDRNDFYQDWRGDYWDNHPYAPGPGPGPGPYPY